MKKFIILFCISVFISACAMTQRADFSASLNIVQTSSVLSELQDSQDKELARLAQQEGVAQQEVGVPVPWLNPITGNSGNVVTGPPYRKNGRICRDFTHTAYQQGTTITARETMCG